MKMTQRSAAAPKRRAARARPTRKLSDQRAHLRARLTAYLNELGYTTAAPDLAGRFQPELRRRNPYRGSLVYGATVIGRDLTDPAQHERLVFFANRRTTKRSAIQLYIAVPKNDVERLDTLLERLGIRTHARGGNVQLLVVD